MDEISQWLIPVDTNLQQIALYSHLALLQNLSGDAFKIEQHVIDLINDIYGSKYIRPNPSHHHFLVRDSRPDPSLFETSIRKESNLLKMWKRKKSILGIIRGGRRMMSSF